MFERHPTQGGKNLHKTLLRHYHRAAREPSFIPTTNRRESDRKKQARISGLLKAVSIGVALASVVLGLLLVVSMQE
ncbi:MAG: hypothetical protein OSA84_08990 [Akkermansiaceae bacterium]|nr:hypothetical protein [Akkermansiaceae bacterium]